MVYALHQGKNMAPASKDQPSFFQKLVDGLNVATVVIGCVVGVVSGAVGYGVFKYNVATVDSVQDLSLAVSSIKSKSDKIDSALDRIENSTTELKRTVAVLAESQRRTDIAIESLVTQGNNLTIALIQGGNRGQVTMTEDIPPKPRKKKTATAWETTTQAAK